MCWDAARLIERLRAQLSDCYEAGHQKQEILDSDKEIIKEQQERIEKLDRLLQAVIADGFCPECGDGRGYTVHQTMPFGEPEQVQCQWCDEAAQEVSDE
jgi:hypothetical protein